MSNTSDYKIDGLNARDFSKLMSPKLGRVKPGQNILGRTVTRLGNLGKNLKNFMARLSCYLFKTHRWENDASLMNHVWVHLKSKDDQQGRQLIVVKGIYRQLQKRFEKQFHLGEIQNMLVPVRENVTDRAENDVSTVEESSEEESSREITEETERAEASELNELPNIAEEVVTAAQIASELKGIIENLPRVRQRAPLLIGQAEQLELLLGFIQTQVLDAGQHEIEGLAGVNPLRAHRGLKHSLEVLNHWVDARGQIVQILRDAKEQGVSNEHLDQVINQLTGPNLSRFQRGLRIDLEMLNQNDIVCELSQGRIDEEVGVNSCASIVAEAIQHLLAGEKIETEDDIYSLIRKGIQAHRDHEFGVDRQDFATVLGKVNEDRSAKELALLEGLVPGNLTDEERGIVSMDPVEFAMNYEVKDAQRALEGFDQLTEENQNVFGVMTCNGEVILIYKTSEGNYQVFDSHGRNYHGASRGATLLQFDTLEDVNARLQSIYPDQNQTFTFTLVGMTE